MKQKIIMMLLTVVLSMGLMACGSTPEQPDNEEKKEEVPAGRIEADEEPDDETDVITPENKPADITDFEAITVNIYYSNDDADGFEVAKEEIHTLDVAQILEKLAKYNVIPEGMGFLSMHTQEIDGEMCIDLDMPEEFAEYLETMGSAGEYIIMGSIVNTMLESHEADKIKITVAGGLLVTGHADYPNYFNFFE